MDLESVLFSGRFAIKVVDKDLVEAITKQEDVDAIHGRKFVFEGEDVVFVVIFSHEYLQSLRQRILSLKNPDQAHGFMQENDSVSVLEELEETALQYLSTVRLTASFVPYSSIDQLFRSSKLRPSPIPALVNGDLTPSTTALHAVGVIHLAEYESFNDFGSNLPQQPQPPIANSTRTSNKVPISFPAQKALALPVTPARGCDGATFVQLPNGDVLFWLSTVCRPEISTRQESHFLVVSMTGPPLGETGPIFSGFEHTRHIRELDNLYSQSRLLRPQRPLVNCGLKVVIEAPFETKTVFKRMGSRVIASVSLLNKYTAFSIKVRSAHLLVEQGILASNVSNIVNSCSVSQLHKMSNDGVCLCPGEEFTFLFTLDFELSATTLLPPSGASSGPLTLQAPFVVTWECSETMQESVTTPIMVGVPCPALANVFVQAVVPQSVVPLQPFDICLSIQNRQVDKTCALSLILPVSWGNGHKASISYGQDNMLLTSPQIKPPRAPSFQQPTPASLSGPPTAETLSALEADGFNMMGDDDTMSTVSMSTSRKGEGLRQRVGNIASGMKGMRLKRPTKPPTFETQKSIRMPFTLPQDTKPEQFMTVNSVAGLVGFRVPDGLKGGDTIELEIFGQGSKGQSLSDNKVGSTVTSPVPTTQPHIPYRTGPPSLLSGIDVETIAVKEMSTLTQHTTAVVPTVKELDIGEIAPGASISVSVKCVALGDPGTVTVSNMRLLDSVSSSTRVVSALCDVVVCHP